MSVSRTLATLAATALLAIPGFASGQMLGPTPYLQFADSPFAGVSGFSYFYLETFEDHLFNVPGVTASAGGVTSVVFGPNSHDSVDGDDGSIDGSGLAGDDFYSSAGATGILFTFSKSVLGGLPTHAGLVWTDGLDPIFFEAFDGDGNLLGSVTGNHADGTFEGTTADDRFYGAVNAGGIGSIFIKSGTSGGIEIDHLQYGLDASLATPEPTTIVLVSSGLLGLAAMRRRRKA